MSRTWTDNELWVKAVKDDLKWFIKETVRVEKELVKAEKAVAAERQKKAKK